MYIPKRYLLIISAILITLTSAPLMAQNGIPGAAAEGRWDITIEWGDNSVPSWLSIETSGSQALVGEFVGPSGSARPISEITYSEDTGTYSFTIPPQWASYDSDPHFEFTLEDGELSGWTTGPDGQQYEWTAQRAPALHRESEPSWGETINLLDNDFSHWQVPENSRFRMEDGVLINEASGGNLVSKQEFEDFKMHVEFRYPEGSNSGIYLRGRYEVQIADNYGEEPESHFLGGIYGFIDPTVNAARKAGQWQTYDITLIGRMVTVVLNGVEVISNRPIPGITGGALDSNEGEPGPIMLQGDHGPVEFRNFSIMPASYN